MAKIHRSSRQLQARHFKQLIAAEKRREDLLQTRRFHSDIYDRANLFVKAGDSTELQAHRYSNYSALCIEEGVTALSLAEFATLNRRISLLSVRIRNASRWR